jgi:hypothetical protein
LKLFFITVSQAGKLFDTGIQMRNVKTVKLSLTIFKKACASLTTFLFLFADLRTLAENFRSWLNYIHQACSFSKPKTKY